MRWKGTRNLLLVVGLAVVLSGCKVNSEAVQVIQSIRVYPGLTWVSERSVGGDETEPPTGYEITYASRFEAQTVRDYYSLTMNQDGWMVAESRSPSDGGEAFLLRMRKGSYVATITANQAEPKHVVVRVERE